MQTIEKILGDHGCLLVVAHAATTMPTGYKCYALKVRVDGTIIASVTISGAAVTDKTWEDVALLKDDYIPFEIPITSITLTADDDSVLCYLQPV